ncbi:proline and serine-rich protein 3 isoform X2 [Hyperolius riggenbachi]|uniref:proline and serine-rich protein 3 isoform X2 n=1 Tax=Hyperolius riggenbachi TaxID=752182 RepID=UPI0035A352D9
MNSSTAIFSNQGNPFPPPARSRTHYHPSPPHALSEEQRHVVLSPVRLPHHLSEELGSPDLRFLEGGQRLVPGLPESDSSGPFDESWPSSEGSSKTPEQDKRAASPDVMTRIHRGSHAAEPANEDSVLARYIARFRSGRPSSRLERSPPHSAMKDFWWLQTSLDSPDAQRLRAGSGMSAAVGFSPHSLEITPPSAEGSLNDSRVGPDEVDILALQERARKLILQSESSISSGGLVSPEGVGSSPSSGISNPASDVSRVRLPLLDTAPVVPSLHPPVSLSIPSMRSHPTIPPEEDILYQWRLRRKMEQAREGTLPVTTRRRSPSPPIRLPRQVLCTADSSESTIHTAPPEAAESSRLPALQPASCCSHVPLASPSMVPHSASCAIPPHLHLQCDILPCVHRQHSAPCAQRKQEAEPRRPATAPPAGAATAPQTGPEQVVAGLKTEEASERRPHSRPDGPEQRKVRAKGGKSRRTADKGGDGRGSEAPPPASPVHHALEQVISERLFSPLPKPQPRKSQKTTAPPTEESRQLHPRKTTAPPTEESRQLHPRKTTAPPTEESRELHPREITAQLLEEAEDSDGAEFADDPLLQVLREQRRSLRSRLREVDLRLAELEDEETNRIFSDPEPS